MSCWTVQRVMMLSFLMGLLLSLFPLPLHIRQWWPEWLLLMAIFWGIHQPQLFSVGKAFILGLVVDAITGSTLAMHAIPYAMVVYLTRLWGQNFPLWTMIEQLLFISFLLVVATLNHLFLLLFSPLMFSPLVVYIQILMSSLVAWFVINRSLVHWHRQF
ncbi:MAG TPA: rod shape-determining protein MreD [Agitococcus sp.]|nr:rod shape-determining protein MreD [Agitococcus sp.]HMY28461.1 rod shape-determining protein MreD [Agitococcus sp.]HNL81182.1 rod shape-determining protein MreD [Agitococcus sp.]